MITITGLKLKLIPCAYTPYLPSHIRLTTLETDSGKKIEMWVYQWINNHSPVVFLDTEKQEWYVNEDDAEWASYTAGESGSPKMWEHIQRKTDPENCATCGQSLWEN